MIKFKITGQQFLRFQILIQLPSHKMPKLTKSFYSCMFSIIAHMPWHLGKGEEVEMPCPWVVSILDNKTLIQ